MKKKTTLIFAYYSYYDPVFQSAVLPYFRGLSQSDNLQFVLLTFEKNQYKVDDATYVKLKKELEEQDNIIWYRSTWRSGSFKIFKKVYDFFSSMSFARKLIRKHKVDAVYSEAFPGAIMGHHLAKHFKIPHMVHSFEPHTQYMVEAGVWKPSSWEARLLSHYEVKIARHCSHIFTATEEMMKRIRSWGSEAELVRVPSCVDTDIFQFNPTDRNRIRQSFNITEDEIALLYLGKFGGMYMEEEAFAFFKKCIDFEGLKIKIIVLSHDDHERLRQLFSDWEIDEQYWSLKFATREEVSAYISASDFGFVAVRQKPGKRFCSPIKDGEYWSCGLPLIIPDGISDDYLLAEEHRIGIRMQDVSDESFDAVLVAMKDWVERENVEDVRARCRAFALKDRSVGVYQAIYRDIFENI